MLRHLSSTLTRVLQTVRPLVLVGSGIAVGILTAGLFNFLPSLQAQSASPLTIQPDTGRVGIGTTNPSFGLDVATAKSNDFSARIINSYGSSSRQETLLIDSIYASSVPQNDSVLDVASAGNVKFSVKHNGNVGIGTTNPSQKLEVSGGIKVIGSAASPPAASTIVSDNIVKGWVQFGAPPMTIRASYNVASVTYLGAGQYTVTWSTPFASPNYAVVCSAMNSGGDLYVCAAQSFAAGSVLIRTRDVGGGLFVDANQISVMAIGLQ